MIEKIGSSNLLQHYKTSINQQKETTNNTEAPTIAKDIVNKETADATKAYVQGIIAPPKRGIPPKRTSEELINDLISEGKIEGKDFTVNVLENFKDINILKNGKITKKFNYYKDNNKETYNGYTEYHYPLEAPQTAKSETIKNDGLKSTEIRYTADGKFRYRAYNYDSNNSPFKNEEINAKTSSYQLSKYLESKNIPYTTIIDCISDNETEHKIIVFDKNTNKFIHYQILENKDDDVLHAMKTYLDEKDNKSHSIYFSEKETIYTEYKDSFVA